MGYDSPMSDQPTYDNREAVELLVAAAAESSSPALRVSANNAADVLLHHLLSLNGTARFRVQRDAMTDSVIFAARELAVQVYCSDGEIRIRSLPSGQPPAPHVVPPIRYNVVRDRFEGIQEDFFLVPVPGEPRGRRSAVAIIIEVVLSQMDSPASESR
jgi:hypothetical protein